MTARALYDAAMTETALQDAIVEYAQLRGWEVMHISDREPDARDRRELEEGFPDLVLARGDDLVFAECKSATGRLRPKQRRWLGYVRWLTSAELASISGDRRNGQTERSNGDWHDHRPAVTPVDAGAERGNAGRTRTPVCW
jgi:hypothetical protein